MAGGAVAADPLEKASEVVKLWPGGAPGAKGEDPAKDVAVREADSLPLMVPNMLGVEYNARLLQTIVEHVAPAIGWVHPSQRTS